MSSVTFENGFPHIGIQSANCDEFRCIKVYNKIQQHNVNLSDLKQFVSLEHHHLFGRY